MNEDKEYWRNETVGFLALSTVKGVGYWTLYRLFNSVTSFKDLLKNSSRSELEELFHVSLDGANEDWGEFQRSLWERGLELARELSSIGVRLIFDSHSAFPENLRNIPEPPRWIFVQGEIDNLHCSSVAVVGTRKPSSDGLFLARYILALLSRSGRPIVSGLAMGIDQVAHEESIRYSLPTVAVLGTGILKNYPRGSEVLRQEILKCGGTIVTEYLPTQSYSGENFVRRNRIQAALSDYVVPVEWKIKSGTAHTVDFAYRYRKKIINIYLPNTYSMRPELEFSDRERLAQSFEVPFDIARLSEYLELVGADKNYIEGPAQGSFDL